MAFFQRLRLEFLRISTRWVLMTTPPHYLIQVTYLNTASNLLRLTLTQAVIKMKMKKNNGPSLG
jgi:hypothetical protein